MRALNYYKTMNNNTNKENPKHLYYTELQKPSDSYRGIEIHKNGLSEYLVLDGVIICERVKQSRKQIDLFFDDKTNYHASIRPLQAFAHGKQLLMGVK